MKFSQAIAVIILIMVGHASRGDQAIACHDVSSVFQDLQLIECFTQKKVLITTFSKPESEFSYATDFDRRVVTIAKGKNEERVREAAGITGNYRSMQLEDNRLAKPPVVDQIIKKKLGNEHNII